MSNKVAAFVDAWIAENVQCEDEDDAVKFRELTAACLAAAKAAGISKADIEEVYGDLFAHIAACRERIIDQR